LLKLGREWHHHAVHGAAAQGREQDLDRRPLQLNAGVISRSFQVEATSWSVKPKFSDLPVKTLDS
jgi:hypothetical protein